MINIKKINKYWKENKNENILKLPRSRIKSRYQLFEKYLKNKKILHIGCTDWPYTSQEIKNKTLLHIYFNKLSENVFGLDISKKGIEIMKKNNINNVFISDIYKLYKDELFLKQNFDIIVVSEVIEHLTNPGLALESLKKYILKTNPECRIIFTVPNIHNFGIRSIQGLKNKEQVHPDHKFYFSYRTFRTLIENYDFETEYFSYITYHKYPCDIFKKIILKLMSKFFPCVSPYIFFKCRLNYKS